MAQKKKGKEITLNPDFVVKVRGFYIDNKVLLTRIAATVAALFFIFYIVFRFYVSSIEKVETVTVHEQTINNSIFTQGFFVRSEQYIENSVTGTIVPVATDGKKVSNGNTVAIAFGSDEDAATYTRINMLKAELTRYEKLRAVSPSSAIDTKTVDAIISGSVSELMDGILSGKLDMLTGGYSELRDNIIKKQLLLGEAISFDDIINGIKDELVILEAKNISSTEILADDSGYYINSVDGYENAYDYSQITSIMPEDAQALLEAEPAAVPENIMGKLVTGFKWYIVCVLDIEQIGELKVGKNVTIDFPYASTDKLTTKVAAINVSGADKAAVLLECSTMNEELANMRLEDIELIFNTVQGFKIPNSAVREENGVKGVYILRNSLVTFREINIVWSDDEYVLSADPPAPDTTGMTKEQKEEIEAALPKNQVRQYDEVIVEGKDLYDGKTIN